MVQLNETLSLRQAQKRVLEDPAAKASVLLIVLLDGFGGTEFFDWETRTMREEAHALWQADIPATNWDKIGAVLTVLTTDLFCKDLPAFINVCNSLAGGGADFQSYDPATVEEMALAIGETSLLNPLPPFAYEILTYMNAELSEEGFHRPPRILAPFVKGLQAPEQVEEVIAMDALDVKAFWDGQGEKAAAVDQAVKESLTEIIQQLARTPLQNAKVGSAGELRERLRQSLKSSPSEGSRAGTPS